MKKLLIAAFKKEVKPMHLLYLVLTAVTMAMLPLILIAFYDHPCADDFTYGYYTHAFWESSHNIFVTLKWAFHTIKTTYDTWQGTFSSAFLMSLSPAVFNEKFYFLSAFIMMAMIIGSTFYILKVLLVDLLKADKISYGVITLLTIFMFFEQMHSPAQGIYWYNASVHYIFMNSCMLFLLGNCIRILITKKKGQLFVNVILGIVFALLCSGANYVTALSGLMLCGFVLLCGALIKNLRALWILPPFTVYVIGFIFNVIAPGNSFRQVYYTQETPVLAIKNSLINCVRRGHDWFTILLVLVMIMLIPVIWNMVEKMDFAFPLPAVVTFLSFGMVASMFTPSYYALDSEGLARVLNIVKMMFQLLMILNEIYWLGWISKKLKNKYMEFIIPHYYYFYGIIAVIILLVFQTSTNREGEYITYGAYASLVTGQAAAYNQEYLDRLEILQSDEKDIVLPAFQYKPFMLYVDDIVTSADDWRNNAMETWYLKNSIVLEDTTVSEDTTAAGDTTAAD